MKLVITIDTEEDAWGSFLSTGHTVDNIRCIPKLQHLFDEFGVKPTYLITYPVAKDLMAQEILKNIANEGNCEIGTHCHPWNTPPFDEITNAKNSMLCNLPESLQYKKLKILHETIVDNLAVTPVSFRSGRWAFSREVANNLYKLGYRVDTSITPYADWTNSYGPDYSKDSPLPSVIKQISRPGEPTSINRSLIEIPATIGFLQNNFTLSNKVFNILRKNVICKLRLIGVFDKLHMLNKVWLTPELTDSKEMIALSKVMYDHGHDILNMFFHSTTLKIGSTPFVQTKKEEEQFYINIREFLEYAESSGIESIKLSEALNLSSIQDMYINQNHGV